MYEEIKSRIIAYVWRIVGGKGEGPMDREEERRNKDEDKMKE